MVFRVLDTQRGGEVTDKHTQYIAFMLVILGLMATAAGCYFRWEVLSSTSTGVVGAGIMMLRGSGAAKTATDPTA
jgi:hypothetical protein